MHAFLIGALSTLGLLFLVRGLRMAFRFRRGCHGGGCHGGHFHGGHRPGYRARPLDEQGLARAAAEVIKRRLQVQDEQEDIVDHALRDAQASLGGLRATLKDSRQGLGEAFRGEQVDEAALAALFARQDEELKRTRKDLVSALKQIHAVLEPQQRERGADWLASDEGWMPR